MTFFFLLSSIQRIDEDWPLLTFLSSSITSTDKNCSQTKKKKPCKRSSRLSGGLVVSEFFQSEKQRSLDDQLHRSDGLRWANRKSIVTQSLNWEGHFPCTAHGTGLWQTFKLQFVRSITHKQTWLHMNQQRRLHEKILRTRCKQSSTSLKFLLQRRSPAKIKEIFSLCLCNWPQSFFSFVLSFFLSGFTVAFSKSKQIWPHARKIGKSPDVQKLALVPPLARLVPPLAQVGFTDLLLFVTLPIFCPERGFLHQNKAWRLGFSKHPPKRKFPHRNDL